MLVNTQDSNQIAKEQREAIQNIQESQRDGKVLTGLLYADPDAKDLRDILNVSDKPLNEMDRKELCPGSEKLEGINAGLK